MRAIARGAVLALISVWGLSGPLCADDVAVAARKVLAANLESVVTAQIVLEMGASDEHKLEATAFFVDPSGLAVLPMSGIDPMSLLTNAMGGSEDDSMSSKVKDLKLRLHDGTEVPAEVVLRDKDLGIAFVRPAPALAQPVKAVDLSLGVAPELLDLGVCINRLGKIGNWEPGLFLLRVDAKLSKPRTLYVHTNVTTLGCPVFALDGKIIGLSIMRIGASESDPFSAVLDAATNVANLGALPVILPADQILEVAKQALEAKAEPKGEAQAPAEKQPAQ